MTSSSSAIVIDGSNPFSKARIKFILEDDAVGEVASIVASMPSDWMENLITGSSKIAKVLTGASDGVKIMMSSNNDDGKEVEILGNLEAMMKMKRQAQEMAAAPAPAPNPEADQDFDKPEEERPKKRKKQ